MKNKFLKFSLLLFIFIIGLTADIVTKQFAKTEIKNQSTITIINGFLEFSYVENRGMVFGALNNQSTDLKRYALTALTIISIIIILTIIWRIRELPFLYHLPFFMIFSGAIGNLIDRLRFGYVVDFIHMHWQEKLDYPWLYNIADAFIVVGMLILAVLVLFKNAVFETAIKRDRLSE